MTDQVLYYESTYSVQECISRIIEEPQQYSCKWGTDLWYRAELISGSQVWITFTGGQFRKMMQTQYLMEFHPQAEKTLIVLRFQKELFGLSPMTSTMDIDRCMEQRMNAARKA